MFDDLIEVVRNHVFLGGGLNEPYLKAYVTVYCLEYDILPDTYTWQELAETLWTEFDLHKKFDTFEIFDYYIGGDLS